jgi:hypothetical protein
MNITKASVVVPQETTIKPSRKPKSISEPVGERKVYVTGVKSDCPVEGFTLMGIAFHKFVYPVEKSISANQDKVYMPQLVARILAENQVEDIKKRAKEVSFRATIENAEFDNEKPISDENQKRLVTNFLAEDYLILEDASSYNPMTVAAPVEVQNVFTDAEKKENLYESQKKGKK